MITEPNLIQKLPFVHTSVCSQILEGCSKFWLSVRNSARGPLNRNSRGNPSLCWLGGGGRGTRIVNKHFVNKLAFPIYYFRIIFGNSCSEITDPNCFWNYLGSVRSVRRGLPNLLPNCFGNYVQ